MSARTFSLSGRRVDEVVDDVRAQQIERARNNRNWSELSSSALLEDFPGHFTDVETGDTYSLFRADPRHNDQKALAFTVGDEGELAFFELRP